MRACREFNIFLDYVTEMLFNVFCISIYVQVPFTGQVYVLKTKNISNQCNDISVVSSIQSEGKKKYKATSVKTKSKKLHVRKTNAYDIKQCQHVYYA